MKVRTAAVYGIIVFFLLINTGLALSQSAQATSGATETIEPETEWLWGEVVSVDPITNDIKVKTLDYKNDTEIEVTVSVDDKTTYENIKSVTEIKPKDSLSIDYVVGTDGRNLAKNISLEKTEISDVQPAVIEGAAANTMETATTLNPDNLPREKNKTADELPAVSTPEEDLKSHPVKY